MRPGSEVRVLVPAVSLGTLLTPDINFLVKCEEIIFFFACLEKKVQRTLIIF